MRLTTKVCIWFVYRLQRGYSPGITAPILELLRLSIICVVLIFKIWVLEFVLIDLVPANVAVLDEDKSTDNADVDIGEEEIR